MRLDGVEVKLTLNSAQTAQAVQALDLPDVDPWQIFFVEDVTTGLSSSTPLLDANLIIRARQKTKGKDDVTVKFRPGRRSQFSTPWLAMTTTNDGSLETEFKVEQDWAGHRRTLSVSLTSERPDGLVEAVAGGRGIDELLSSDQKRLLDQCAGVPVNLDALSMLPAVSALRWPTFSVPRGVGDSDLKVRAERWTVHDLDFLELSIVADVEQAEKSQAALETFVSGKGLTLAEGEAKTTQVLQVLVAQAARIAP